MQSIPRPEYPRPQFVRKDWLCLNGAWQFEIDSSDSGLERKVHQRELTGTITVPFCPESSLSGVGNTDWMNAVWYRREVEIPSAWAGRQVLLHLQACDYDTTVWVNGQEVQRHRGGFTPITCDLSGLAKPGEKATIVVRARDLKAVTGKPGGKQSLWYENRGCHYTRTTGIWQTVWMEPVSEVHLDRPRITPDLANSRFHLVQPITNSRPGTSLRVTLKDSQGVVSTASVKADADFTPALDLNVPADRRQLWSIQSPFLYDIEIELLDAAGKVIDRAGSYAGLRSVTIDGQAVKINGVKVFQRMVLDQGYYAEGILTAPSDEALVNDIKLSMAAGFNAARLHQKVFEERFLYHADRLGYLVWGEFPDWGMDFEASRATYVTQWLEVLRRDFNHPAIVGWCPLNETARDIEDKIDGLDDVMTGMYLATKAMDTSRPVLDSSGYSHRIRNVDIYDCHDYDQNPQTMLARQRKPLADGTPFANGAEHHRTWSWPYRGQPYFVSEFGGIWWNPAMAGETDSLKTWGYGDRPRNVEEFYSRFKALCDLLLDDPNMFGYCYTQLTDVFQEQNGIYFFDRSSKFDMKRVHDIQTRKAAME